VVVGNLRGPKAAALEQRRLYRRDENDHIVKDRDTLQDAVRCLVNGLSQLGTKPQPQTAIRKNVGSLGWAR